MKHIAESLIETSVRHSEELDAATSQCIAAHLEVCGACRSIADFLRSFYAELDSPDKEILPQVDERVKVFFPGARLIPLYPFRPVLDKVYAGDEYTVVLAAMSPEPPAPRFQTVATLVSAQKDTLLRILRDNAANAFRLYILAENRRQRENAIISFPELALDFITDEKGQAIFKLAEDAVPADWEAVKSVLRLPIREISLRVEQLQHNALTLDEAATDHIIKIACTDDALTLELLPRRPDAPPIALAAIEGTAEQKFLMTLRDGKSSLRLDPLPETLTIRFYC
jgi:hypothetical protein